MPKTREMQMAHDMGTSHGAAGAGTGVVSGSGVGCAAWRKAGLPPLGER